MVRDPLHLDPLHPVVKVESLDIVQDHLHLGHIQEEAKVRKDMAKESPQKDTDTERERAPNLDTLAPVEVRVESHTAKERALRDT